MSQFTYIVTFCACVALVLTDVAVGYKYYSEIDGWVAKQPVMATWDEAVAQCRAEGAVLMSPIRRKQLDVMQSLIDGNTSCYIGTRTVTDPSLFTSVEGVALVDMVITDLLDPLTSQVGQCLVMTHSTFYSAPCTTQLPYLCYKPRTNEDTLTDCGTFDKEYQFNNLTGTCYKYHRQMVKWQEAYKVCVAEGAYLAVVNDAVEANELVKIMTDKSVWVFIGLQGLKGNGAWTSVHMDPLESIYNVWHDAQRPTDQCCNFGSINPNSGKLREQSENQKFYFLCEKDPKIVRFSVTNSNKNENEILL